MTRQKALISAIEIIKKNNNEESQEIVSKLEEILSENPFRSWTKESIIDAILTYVDEHNNLPGEKDLRIANKLPSITVIKNKFGTSAIRKLYKTYFPNLNMRNKNSSSPYRFYDKEDFIRIFKENYERIKQEKKVRYVNMDLYDKNRTQGTPIIYTIMRQYGCSCYDDLLIACGYKIDIKELRPSINVTFLD